MLTCAGMQDVAILRQAPGWRPSMPELEAILPPAGRPKGKNRTAARK